MRNKIVLVVLAFLAGIAIVVALGGVKFFQVRKAMQEHASFSPPPESVTSLVAKEEDWIPALKAVGSTAAVQGVTVSTDQPGIVHRRSCARRRRRCGWPGRISYVSRTC